MPVDIERVKAAHPIAEVIAAHGVELRATGRRYMGRCPFHADDRPSFVVYPDTQSFHCFGCGASGDVIDFVRRTHDLDFRAAVDFLGERPGHDRPAGEGAAPTRHGSPPPLSPPRPSVDDRLILTVACEVYHETLLRTPHALRYLEQRGIPSWLARRARLGFSDGRQLAPYLKRRRLSLRRASEMGLFYPDQQHGGAREAMRGRVVIPDLRAGHCGWMTGRMPTDGADVPYLGLALPRPLLGYEAVRGHQRVLLTEGPFDWLTLVGWGLPACALLGTQPGARTLRLLGRARSVVLVLDGDEPGRVAAAQLAQVLGDRASVIELPAGVKDVNQLAQQVDGRETFFRLLDQAQGREKGATRDVAQA
ncbi:MAG: CHC2 zinc finger domain-containing protein [Candidatus Nanopelagicales bacterium]